MYPIHGLHEATEAQGSELSRMNPNLGAAICGARLFFWLRSRFVYLFTCQQAVTSAAVETLTCSYLH